MLNLWLLLASSPDVEDKAGVYSFLFHCIFPLGGLLMQAPEDKGTRYQPLLCMCHRKSSKRAAENMPCTILTHSPVLAPQDTTLVHSGFRAKVAQGCGMQDTRAHYLVIPSNTETLVESSVRQWCPWTTTVCQQGEDLIGYKLFSHYLFNLHNLSGLYYFPYDTTEKTGLWVVLQFIKYLLRACFVSDTLLGTGDKAVSKADKSLALTELGF